MTHPIDAHARSRLRVLVLFIALLFVVLLAWRFGSPSSPSVSPTPHTPTSEPLVPTPLPTPERSETDPTAAPTRVFIPPTANPTPPAIAATDPSASSSTEKPAQPIYPIAASNAPGYARIGIGVPGGDVSSFAFGDGLPGWYLNWRVEPDVDPPAGVAFAQMVRLSEAGFRPDAGVIAATAAAHPGSLWLIGNEPDVPWQDNSTPEQYAHTYGIVYEAIKGADPSASVAIGGVSQPTPMRIAYIERILEAYLKEYGAEMPVDVWNIHAFILREERESWGVGIPPGFSDDQGQLYEIADHTDMTRFRKLILNFREWMAARGYQDKPLIITEYGVLMPESYGFGPEVVTQFMADTFDFFLTARDAETGLPTDDYRLVQAFCWYSASDTVYPTPNLFDPETGQVTEVGQLFRSYVAALR